MHKQSVPMKGVDAQRSSDSCENVDSHSACGVVVYRKHLGTCINPHNHWVSCALFSALIFAREDGVMSVDPPDLSVSTESALLTLVPDPCVVSCPVAFVFSSSRESLQYSNCLAIYSKDLWNILP